MANLYKARMENNVQPVILPPTNDSVFQDFSLEPQLIRARSMNSANLIVNSADGVTFENENGPVNLVVGQFEAPGSILMRKVKRMAIKSVLFSHATPNVNVRNNQFLIYRKDNNTITEVILPEFFYKSPYELVASMIIYFNGEPGLVGMNFFAVQSSSGVENIFSIRSLIPFVILRKSTAVLYGTNMYGLIPAPAAETIPELSAIAKTYQDMGPVHLQYTAYVDFCSSYLNNYTKLASSTTAFGQNSFIYRLYLPRWDGYTSDPINTYQPTIKRNITDIVENPTYFTWNPEESISTMDIQLRDEFGQLFYVPSYYITTSNDITDVKGAGIQWSLIFNCEI